MKLSSETFTKPYLLLKHCQCKGCLKFIENILEGLDFLKIKFIYSDKIQLRVCEMFQNNDGKNIGSNKNHLKACSLCRLGVRIYKPGCTEHWVQYTFKEEGNSLNF